MRRCSCSYRFSFNASRTMAWSGFSLHWYGRCCSIRLTSGTRCRTASSSPSRRLGHRHGSRHARRHRYVPVQLSFQELSRLASFLPLVLPEIIIGVSLLILFAADRAAAVARDDFIAHVTFNIPFVVLIVSSRLDEFDSSVIEAAYDLGAGSGKCSLKVVLPCPCPAIVAAFLIAMTLSLEDFVITFFVAGPGSTTLPAPDLLHDSFRRFAGHQCAFRHAPRRVDRPGLLSKGVYRYLFQR